MNRSFPLALCAVAVVAACSESPPMLSPGADGAGISAHVTQAGNGNAWHGYHAPEIAHVVNSAGIELCAAWSDGYLFTRDDGMYADVDHFAYAFRWRPAGEEAWQESDARAESGSSTACVTAGAIPSGDLQVEVDAMARHAVRVGQRNVVTTHHAMTARLTIAAGGEERGPFTVEVVPGQSDVSAGAQRQFIALVREDGSPAVIADAVVAWSSDNEAVATVDGDGLATGVAEGAATIRATYAGYSGEATLNVTAASTAQRFTVGPAGGTFSLFGGDVVFEFSPGALSHDTEISVAPVSITDVPNGWAMLGNSGYQFAPAGLQFNDPANSPVWLTLGFDPADLPPGAELYPAKIVDGRALPLGEKQVGPASTRSLITGFSRAVHLIWSCLCPPNVSRIEVTPESTRLEPTETTYLLAEAFDTEGDPYHFESGGPVQWTSSNNSIVEVTQVTSRRALIRAVNVGNATVTATLRGVSQQVPVTVTTRVARVQVEPATASVERGGTQQFIATAYDMYDTVLSGPRFQPTWRSGQPCYASVDGDGLATGLNPGNATIIATIQGVSGSAHIGVTDPSPVGSVPESLQGDWVVCRRSDGAFLYTLHLDHEPEATVVTGRITLPSGFNTALSPGSWRDNIFEINWTLQVQGGARTFGIVGAQAVTADRLDGRYNDRISLSTYDVILVRQRN